MLRSLVSLLLMTGSALFISGCSDSMMDGMDNSFSFTIDKTIPVNHISRAAVASDKLDLWESGPVFMRNRSFVRSVGVRSVSCTITDAEGIPQTISGTLSISDSKGGESKPVASFENVSMGSMMGGSIHRMNMHDDGRRMMEGMMMDTTRMMMHFMCKGDQDSMRFMMQFHFEMDAGCANMDMMN